MNMQPEWRLSKNGKFEWIHLDESPTMLKLRLEPTGKLRTKDYYYYLVEAEGRKFIHRYPNA